MTRDEAVRAIEIGIELVEEELGNGLDIIATGEMGIGNTTAASAVIAALTGEPMATVTGRGTGIGAEALAKVAVIEMALAANQPDAKEADRRAGEGGRPRDRGHDSMFSGRRRTASRWSWTASSAPHRRSPPCASAMSA